MVYPYKTIEFNMFKIDKVIERPMYIGELIEIKWCFYKTIDKPAEYIIDLVPVVQAGDLNNVYLLDSGSVNSQPGYHCSGKTLKASEEITKGIYKVRMTLQYHPNPVRTITREFITDNTVLINH
jgi:hypothetical protein